MNQAFPLYKDNSNDQLKDQALGRPSYHTHHGPHLAHDATTSERFMATVKEVLADPHNGPAQFAKQVAKGVYLGGTLGAMIGLSIYTKQSLVLKKALYYIDQNTFGSSKIIFELVKPYGLIGGMMFGSHYIFYNQLWRANSQNGLLYDLWLGNSIYFSVWTAALWTPKYWWVGFYLGGFLGFLYYSLVFGLPGSLNTPGYAQTFDVGLTEDDKFHLKYRMGLKGDL